MKTSEKKENLKAVCIIAAFYAVLELCGVTCPIKYLTGISCAGCGMSRAWISVFRGDIAAALQYHPLFWLVIPGGVFLLLRHKLPRKVLQAGVIVICSLMLAVYLWRMFSGSSEVVVFRPEEGLIWRAIRRGMRFVSGREV